MEIVENVNAPPKPKTVIFRYMKFNPTLGVIETEKRGGIMISAIQIKENPNKYQIKAIICNRNKIFRKAVAWKLLSGPNPIPVLEVNSLSLESLIECITEDNSVAIKLHRELVKICESIRTAKSAHTEYSKKMQHSGASVYEYIA